MVISLKNEAALLKEVICIGMRYAENRGAAQFDGSDSAEQKVEYIYKLLVHDKLLQPLAKDQLALPAMKHKLAHWMARTLPPEHPLLK